jgi:hypothetical protein
MNWQISFLLTITKSSKISLTARLFECVLLRRHTSPFVLGLRMIHHHFRGSDIYILCVSHNRCTAVQISNVKLRTRAMPICTHRVVCVYSSFCSRFSAATASLCSGAMITLHLLFHLSQFGLSVSF